MQARTIGEVFRGIPARTSSGKPVYRGARRKLARAVYRGRSRPKIDPAAIEAFLELQRVRRENQVRAILRMEAAMTRRLERQKLRQEELPL